MAPPETKTQIRMKLRISNQLNMVGSCITVADDQRYKPVWEGKPPLGFANGIAILKAGHTALTQKASEAGSTSSGAGDAKALAEIALEDNAHLLARALAVHFRSTGDVTRRAKVDFSRSEIVRLRDNDLASTAISIRDVGVGAVKEPKAIDNGVSPEIIDTLSASITSFTTEMSKPRGKIVSRSTLLKELETDIAGLLTLLSDLDDLVLQFNKTPAGKSFIEAWNGARMIIDRVGEISKPTPAPTPVPAK